MDLDKYLNAEVPSDYRAIDGNIKYVQRALESMALPNIGDLYSNDTREINATVDAISNLIEQKQKDINLRNELQEKITELKFDRNTMEQKWNSACEKNQKLSNELGNFENKFNKGKKEWEAQIKELTAERDKVKKEYNQLLRKMAEFQHTTKKKEATQVKLQEQLRKALGETNTQYRNNFDVTDFLHVNGTDLAPAYQEFAMVVGRSYEDNVSKLLGENQEFRDCLETFQKELDVIAQEKIDCYITLQPPESTLNQITILKSDIFRLPITTVKTAIQRVFMENIRKFGHFYAELCSELAVYTLLKGLNENLSSADDLKKLIHNYKEIVFKQERQINALRTQLAQEQANMEGKIKEIEVMSSQLKDQLARAGDKQKELAEKERQMDMMRIKMEREASSKDN